MLKRKSHQHIFPEVIVSGKVSRLEKKISGLEMVIAHLRDDIQQMKDRPPFGIDIDQYEYQLAWELKDLAKARGLLHQLTAPARVNEIEVESYLNFVVELGDFGPAK